MGAPICRSSRLTPRQRQVTGENEGIIAWRGRTGISFSGAVRRGPVTVPGLLPSLDGQVRIALLEFESGGGQARGQHQQIGLGHRRGGIDAQEARHVGLRPEDAIGLGDQAIAGGHGGRPQRAAGLFTPDEVDGGNLLGEAIIGLDRLRLESAGHSGLRSGETGQYGVGGQGGDMFGAAQVSAAQAVTRISTSATTEPET